MLKCIPFIRHSLNIFVLIYYLRNFAMERKVNNEGRILETAYNIIEQVNTLLVSAANPSDETSLSIRLSLIKASVFCLII